MQTLNGQYSYPAKHSTQKEKFHILLSDFRYNYRELDEFLDKEMEPLKLSKIFRQLHCSLTYYLPLLSNNDIQIGTPDSAMGEIFMLDEFFSIIENLKVGILNLKIKRILIRLYPGQHVTLSIKRG
jgi:hypothetical protein